MNLKYGKVNYKLLILCLTILIVVGIIAIVVIVNQKKSKQIITNVDFKTFRSQFKYEITTSSINNNQMEYTIEIVPNIPGDRIYKNIKVSFNVMGEGTVDSAGMITRRNLRTMVNDIKLKKDGTYKGTFTYTLDGSDIFKSIDESRFALIPYEASGTIKEFS